MNPQDVRIVRGDPIGAQDNQNALANERNDMPTQDCSYCSSAIAAKALGMSGEHALKGCNKGGTSPDPATCP